MDTDDIYMQRCLQLARYGAGYVAPNPMVGAVLVHNERIIGEGYHQQYGQSHAEVNCLNSILPHLQHLIKDSTLYVSLEPCNHFGKTPPCADKIIEYQIPKVIIACTDPFEKVNGKGIDKLKAAGVEVITGILQKEAIELNKRFFTFHEKNRPYIILKWAQSGNLKIACGDYKAVKISNEITDRLVHKWRSEEAAIMVGTNTALLDDPSLTTRLWPGNDPLRVVIDNKLILPASHHLMDNTVDTLIFNKIRHESIGKTDLYKYGEDENTCNVITKVLQKRKILSLIVEGGATLLQSFIDNGYWDEARIITNKELQIDNGISAPELKMGQLFNSENILGNEICYFSNRNV